MSCGGGGGGATLTCYVCYSVDTSRMLRTLLSTPGADPKLVTVFIDGYFEVSILSFPVCIFLLRVNLT